MNKISMELKQDEIELILAYIREDNEEVFRTNIPEKLTALYYTFQKKLEKELRESNNKIFALERKLDRFKKAEKEEVANGNFMETERDSYEVALVLLYCLQQLKTYRLTKTKFLYILYNAYASWLAGRKERLFTEHPVATKFGPQFWRVYKRISLQAQVPYEYWSSFCKKNAGVARFLDNVARKYYDYSENMLKDPIMKSAPYLHALPEHNDGKWNKEITDSDIFVWRSEAK